MEDSFDELSSFQLLKRVLYSTLLSLESYNNTTVKISNDGEHKLD